MPSIYSIGSFIEKKFNNAQLGSISIEILLILTAPIVNIRLLFQLLFIFLRKNDLLKHSKFNKIKKFKNKHIGERCFIIGTGPSLNVEDLNKLNNEICFSVNSIMKLFDKTDWQPSYYSFYCPTFYQKYKDLIHKAIADHKITYIFLPHNRSKEQKKNIPSAIPFFRLLSSRPYTIINPHSSYYSRPNTVLDPDLTKYIYRGKFSGNAYAYVDGSHSIIPAIMQIAVYMGFNEIYLLGCDCGLNEGKMHFDGGEHVDEDLLKKIKEREYNAYIVTIRGYEAAKEYADTHGLKIYNATRGGKLEVFERIDLDNVLSLSQ